MRVVQYNILQALTSNHERGSITITRRNVQMYEIANPAKDEVKWPDDEIAPPPKCPPKEPPPKPTDPCQVTVTGLAAL